MKWILLVLFSAFTSVVGLTPYIDYSNSNDTKFVNNHLGVGFDHLFSGATIRLGIEYLDINTFGSVHDPEGSEIITKQTLLALPIVIERHWHIKSSFAVFFGVGYKVYYQESLSTNSVDTIESVQAIGGDTIVSAYSEEIQSHFFYKLGISYNIYDNVTISCFKTWQTIKNNIHYTFLNNNTIRQTSELNYEPITISVQYSF